MTAVPENPITPPPEQKQQKLSVFSILLPLLGIVFVISATMFIYQSGFWKNYLSPKPSQSPAASLPASAEPIKEIESKDLPQAHNNFGFNIFQSLYQQEKENLFISPTSISLALSMVYNGAEGETKKAMADTMHIQGIELEKLNQASLDLYQRLQTADPKVEINIANAIWGDAGAGIQFKQQFIDATQNYYQAEVRSVDFSQFNIVSLVNSWVKEKTKGKIDKIIDNPDFLVALVNAIYFKGDWTHEFDAKLTEDKNFTLLDGSVEKHPLMKQKREDFRYLENNDFQAVSLPYGENKELSMYVFLPKNNLDSFLNILSPDNWQTWMGQFKKMEGTVLLPKFKMEYKKELSSVLSQLGMAMAFSNQANFSNMVDKIDLKIDKVIHKTFVEVDEKGTEAAAVTAITLKATGVMEKPTPPPTFYMEVNKPFFFAIVDQQSQEILFMGTLKRPQYGTMKL